MGCCRPFELVQRESRDNYRNTAPSLRPTPHTYIEIPPENFPRQPDNAKGTIPFRRAPKFLDLLWAHYWAFRAVGHAVEVIGDGNKRQSCFRVWRVLRNRAEACSMGAVSGNPLGFIAHAGSGI